MFEDKICLPELRFRARHGVLPAEQENEQDFTVGLEVLYDCAAAGEADDLKLALDYRRLYRAAAEVMLGEPRQLLEALATDIARIILGLDGVKRVTVRLRKEAADFGACAVPSEVEITRWPGDL